MKIRGTKKMKAVLYIGLFLVWTGPILYSYDLGDVNHDSVRNIVDSLLIAQYYVGRPVEDIDLELADTDANGTINIVDSLLVAQLYIGVIDILPGELIATPTPIPGYPVNWYALQKAFPLSAKEEEKLIQNGFLVLRSPAMDTITEAYCDLADHIEVPSFITSDALLHIFHITYAHMLETVEIKFLISDLRTLLDMFNTGVKTEFDRCGSGTICKEAARQLWIFSAVADALINGRQTVQGEDVGIINADADVILKKIVDHTFTSSATGEDYTVYKPRGHYSGDPELEQYFRAMQWLRKKKITYSDGNDPLNDEYQFIAAVIMGYVISGRTEMYDLWNKIYTFIKKLSISKESITPVTVEQVMKNYYKTQYENEGYGILNDLEELALIQDELKEHDPDLLQYVQFLGEPYYLDNEIMEKTLSPHVPDRYLPNGLDIASTIFASQTAYELNGEEMSNYPGLSDKLDELSAQYGMRQEEEWKESFIDYWLYTLQSLSSSAEAYAPAFMSGDAWLKEKLNTQLSSWAELHSDNVNYEPTPSSIPTPEPTPVPTTAPEPVQIEYRCVNQTASVNQIRFNINIVNCSDITYDLGDIVVRYFYTKEGTSGEQVVFDYAVVGKEKIYGEFSGGYLQIAFLPEA
ncbi:MAG: DUF3160 domain-containing protein, partial [Spirochaetales bacterium]|nr:DUF3160 domain-containing protein [Spirochaetales bacterium]